MKKNKFGYKVDIGQRCENVIEPDEEYGSWERSYRNWFEKISKTKNVPKSIEDLHHKYRRGEFENWDDCYKFYVKTSDCQEFKYGSCPCYSYFDVH